MPDLNTVPESPRILSLSRRTSSQQMPPPSAPVSGSAPSDIALNILPSNLNAVTTGAPIAPSLPSPILATATASSQPPADVSSATTGPGPIRHPRPLTAAELHQQLEKEQEAVVCFSRVCWPHLFATRANLHPYRSTVLPESSTSSVRRTTLPSLPTHLPPPRVPQPRAPRYPSFLMADSTCFLDRAFPSPPPADDGTRGADQAPAPGV